MHPMITRWFNNPPKRTNFSRLVELIAVNGGSIDINKVGVVPNQSVWKRAGLSPNEALELTGLVQFLFGCIYMTGQVEELQIEIFQAVQREIARVESGSLVYVPTHGEVEKFS